MSFQAYIDAVEYKTGKTPLEIVALAQAKGFDTENGKPMEVATWLKEEFGIGHGHAMAMTHVIKKGAVIGDKHVGSTGAHRDESETLRLDGIKNR